MIRTFHSPIQNLHNPSTYFARGRMVETREKVDRVAALLEASSRHGEVCEVTSLDGMGSFLAAVHDPNYLTFLETCHANWQRLYPSDGCDAVVLAHNYAMRNMSAAPPMNFQAQLGYYLSGGNVPVMMNTWRAVVAAASCALAGASYISQGGEKAYASCRPPGHHAYADMAGGFCYLNNAAAAAAFLARDGRKVAIVDLDVHHGNGTQSIFYSRRDVFFLSVHADSRNAYPWYSGCDSEVGEGEGEGFTMNRNMALGAGDPEYLAAVETCLDAVAQFGPHSVVVSLGFDAYSGDPSGLANVSTAGFQKMGKLLADLNTPLLLIQEGGYAVEALTSNLDSFLTGIQH